MVHLRERGSPEGIETMLASFQERQEVLGAATFKQLEERYR
jgi:hypothetical protein